MYVDLEPPSQHHRYRVTLIGPLSAITDAEHFIIEHYGAYGPQVISTTGHEDTSDRDQVKLCIELNWNSEVITRMLLQEIAENTKDQVRVQLANVPTAERDPW